LSVCISFLVKNAEGETRSPFQITVPSSHVFISELVEQMMV